MNLSTQPVQYSLVESCLYHITSQLYKLISVLRIVIEWIFLKATHKLPSLKLTVHPWKWAIPPKQSSSNHPFSGANWLLVGKMRLPKKVGKDGPTWSPNGWGLLHLWTCHWVHVVVYRCRTAWGCWRLTTFVFCGLVLVKYCTPYILIISDT